VARNNVAAGAGGKISTWVLETLIYAAAKLKRWRRLVLIGP